MNRRTLLLLGAAAVASVGAALVLTPEMDERSAPPGGQGGLAFEGLAGKLQGASRIEIGKHDAKLELQRQGEAWILPAKGGYPARPERVRELLVGLTELRLAEARTSDPSQFDRLGVDDPMRPGSTALLLRVLDAQGGAIAELIVGRRRVRTQGNVPESVYVRRPGQNQSWLAEGRLPVDADPQLWVDRDIVNLPHDRIRRVTVHRMDEPELVLVRGDGAEAKLRLTEPAGTPPSDEVALDEIGRAFEFLTFLDVKPAAEIPGSALGESRFEMADGSSITVQPHKDGDKLWIRLQAEGGDEANRLNARWQGWAYQVGAWKEKAFVPRLTDLAARESAARSGEAPAEAPR
ncbi:MAG: DUF4340 domain-containing protein [Acetobacteraceae bacterium]|nr:DUF4340 domain-containing protein [Acetobacteraceae bacterium]